MADINDDTYSLELVDGSVWHLTGGEAVKDWLGELAHIMGLTRALKKPTHMIRFYGVKDLTSPPHETPHFMGSGAKGWQPFRNGGIHRVWRHYRVPEIHVELHRDFLDHEEIRYINMWSALRELHRHALSQGGTPVHATLAALDGKGVLIAGAGGTGKSTCYSRLPHYWEPLCDDQALVLPTGNGDFRVHPFPTWSDHLWRESKKQWHVERSVPLKAVFFLEQAPKDEVLPFEAPSEALLKCMEAAKQAWQPIWSKMERAERNAQSATLFDNLTPMARLIPAYRLQATLNGEFWKEIEKVFFQV